MIHLSQEDSMKDISSIFSISKLSNAVKESFNVSIQEKSPSSTLTLTPHFLLFEIITVQ